MIAEAGAAFFDFVKEQLGETSPTSIGGASGLKGASIPLPFANEPHLFRTENRVVLASNAELATEVLGNLGGTGKGLLGNNDFRSFATAFTAKSTFFSYVSPQAGKVLSGLQENSDMDMEDMLGPAGGMLKLEKDTSGLSSVHATDKGLVYRVKYKGLGGAVPLAGLAPLGIAMVLPAAGSMEQIMAGKIITEMQSNSRNLYIAVYADAIDNPRVGFPQPGDYKNSTDYFIALSGKNPSETRVLAAQPDFVAGWKKPAANWSRFTAENNGWCVVAGEDESTDAGTPFIFSANLLNEEITTFDGNSGVKIDPNTPLGTKVVVGSFGGGKTVLDSKDPNFWSNFNPGAQPFKKGTILRP